MATWTQRDQELLDQMIERNKEIFRKAKEHADRLNGQYIAELADKYQASYGGDREEAEKVARSQIFGRNY